MVTYAEAPTLATDLIEAIEAELAEERAARTDHRPHVSDTIYCLRKAWRRRQVVDGVHVYSVPKEEENHRLVLLIGQALHSIVAKAQGRESNKQLETDWLVGEADARLLEDGTIEEFKTARAGFGLDDPIKWPHYAEQVGAYLVIARDMHAKGLIPTWVNRAVLHVLHINFNNRPQPYTLKQQKKESDQAYARRQAERDQKYQDDLAQWIRENGEHSNLRSWPLQFSLRELDRWKLELQRRVGLILGPKQPGTNECAPAKGSGQQSWECTYCAFHVTKGGDCPGGIGRSAPFFPMDLESL